MAESMPPESKKEKRSLLQRSEFWSLLLTGLATVVAVASFLGWQVEKRKRLDLVYRAKLSLFSPDIQSSQESLGALRRPSDHATDTKVSALIVNSGGIAIERRDIERPSILQFDSAHARIIEAHVTQEKSTRPRGKPYGGRERCAHRPRAAERWQLL